MRPFTQPAWFPRQRGSDIIATQPPSSPLGRILPRRAERAVGAALADTRVVLVNGARQAGKSTLVRTIGATRAADVRILDVPSQRAAAVLDPEAFIESEELVIIDEVQRVPELLLAIKASVDADPRPGRFLLAGSARVLRLRSVPDALPGRVETIELWPLSQGEIEGKPDDFVAAAFDRGPELACDCGEDRAGYARRVAAGGFPEALARSDPRRRGRFHDAYVSDLVSREVPLISEIERVHELEVLIGLLAARSAQPLVPANLARASGLSRDTVGRYLALLEHLFVIKRIPAWSRRISTRAVGTRKVTFVDSGVAARQIGVDETRMLDIAGPLGPLLEGFVLMEIARQLTWSTEDARLFHYRTKDGVEVDAILENRRGQVVAIEIKASSTIHGADFRGLRHVQERIGGDLVVGLVLYTGTRSLSFGPRLRAMPISALWEVGTRAV